MPPKVGKVGSKPVSHTPKKTTSSSSSSKSSKTSSSSSSSTAQKSAPQKPRNVDKVDFGKSKSIASAGTYSKPAMKPLREDRDKFMREMRDSEPPKPELKTPRNLIRDKERTARDVATEKDTASKTIEEQARELGTDRDPRVLGPYGIRNYKPEPYQRDGRDVAMDVGMMGAAIFGGPPGQIIAGVYEAGTKIRDYIMQKEADKYNEQHKTEGD